MSVSVCLSLCVFSSVRDHVFGTTRPITTKFFLCTLHLGRGSVLLWQGSDTLRISGVMDDVIFAHKLRLVDVAARLRQRGSHAGLGLARRNTRCRQQKLGTITSSKTVVWFSLCAVNPTLMFGYIHTQAYIGLETFGIQGLGY